MKISRKIALILLLFLGLSACSITDYMRTMQIEVMKPAAITLSPDIRTVAIMKLADNDSIANQYVKRSGTYINVVEEDNLLPNILVDALAELLKNGKYFDKVLNFKDSTQFVAPSNYNIDQRGLLFEQTGADYCIFLNKLNFDIATINSAEDMMTMNDAEVSWFMFVKNDSLSYYYIQRDTLYFDAKNVPSHLSGNKLIEYCKNNSADYLGRAFGAKVIPTWLKVERGYYWSKNQEMMKAEKCFADNEWLNGAQILNKLTKSKNAKIAAKASYNMALACEMEGKLDAAIDWLVKSYSLLITDNEQHRVNCQRYINILVNRKKEIELLAKQVRN